jgi:osmoprotectant transport system permease protein
MLSDVLRTQLENLPANLAGHLLVTVVALASGLILSIPLSVVAVRSPAWRHPILSIIGVFQTIPGLALLALAIPLLVALQSELAPFFTISPLGFLPAVIALTLYSMLPVVRNAVTGILGVDAAAVEAGRGVGMTRSQILARVELPLALPVIIAGIRTATVWTVGTATLATPVGQRCLGNFIFQGLQTRNWSAVIIGCVASALLAIGLDFLIAALQRGVERRSRTHVTITSGGLIAVFSLAILGPQIAAGVLSPSPGRASGASSVAESGGPLAAPADSADSAPLVIGAKTFTEQYVLQEVIALRLESLGLTTKRLEGLGSTVIFDALAAGQVDVYVDYSGTIWANLMRREAVAAPWVVLAQIGAWLQEQHGIRLLGALGFENAYALAVRRAQATKLQLVTISDLSAHARDLKIGGDYEFFGRREWSDLDRIYRLPFAARLSLDSAFMYGAAARGDVDVISAFSSDGRIAAFDLVVLADDRRAIPPYDAMVLLSARAANRGDVVAALQPLVGAIPVEVMREANYMVDRDQDKRTVRQAAAWLLERIAR